MYKSKKHLAVQSRFVQAEKNSRHTKYLSLIRGNARNIVCMVDFFSSLSINEFVQQQKKSDCT